MTATRPWAVRSKPQAFFSGSIPSNHHYGWSQSNLVSCWRSCSVSKVGVHKKAFRFRRRGSDNSLGCIAFTVPDWYIGKAVSEAASANRKKFLLSTAPLHDQRCYVSRVM